MVNLIENFIYDNVDDQYRCMKFMATLSEAQTLNVSDKLVSALYKSAIDKYQYIDFGNIPNSKGDITRLKEYSIITETITLLNELKSKAGIVKLDELQIIETTLNIIESNKTDFCAGFIQNKQVIIVLYNTMVLSIIAGLNFIISTMVEYISVPNGEYEAVLTRHKNNKSMDNLLIKNLNEFNTFTIKGDLKKLFNVTLNKKGFLGGGVAATGVIIVIGTIVVTIALVSIIRELIYYVYNLRMSVSEYLDEQAKFIDMNAMLLKTNPSMKTANNRKSVIVKQENQAKKLRNISDKFRLKFEVSDSNTKKEINKKISIDDIQTSMTNVDDNVGFSLM